MADEGAERPGGVVEIHQHESADDRIKACLRLKGIHIRDGKAAPVEAALSCPCSRLLCRIFGAINAEHASRRPDQPCGEKRNVASTGADVEHAHSDADAGAMEHLLSEFAPEG